MSVRPVKRIRNTSVKVARFSPPSIVAVPPPPPWFLLNRERKAMAAASIIPAPLPLSWPKSIGRIRTVVGRSLPFLGAALAVAALVGFNSASRDANQKQSRSFSSRLAVQDEADAATKTGGLHLPTVAVLPITNAETPRLNAKQMRILQQLAKARSDDLERQLIAASFAARIRSNQACMDAMSRMTESTLRSSAHSTAVMNAGMEELGRAISGACPTCGGYHCSCHW